MLWSLGNITKKSFITSFNRSTCLLNYFFHRFLIRSLDSHTFSLVEKSANFWLMSLMLQMLDMLSDVFTKESNLVCSTFRSSLTSRGLGLLGLPLGLWLLRGLTSTLRLRLRLSASSFFSLFTFRAGWSLPAEGGRSLPPEGGSSLPPEGVRFLNEASYCLFMSLFSKFSFCFWLNLLSGFFVKKSNI